MPSASGCQLPVSASAHYTCASDERTAVDGGMPRGTLDSIT
jgi:hypothetical protein